MKNKKKKIFKTITAQNLYHPRHLTLRTYNRFISQFIDKYNWGCINAQGEKSFRYSQHWINDVPYQSYIRLREKPNIGTYRDICLADHLQARQNPEWFLFYTSSPFSDLCLLCGDIDPIQGHGMEECIEAVEYIQTRIFPGIYWEPSTTNRGIHFYVIFDFSTFTPHCGNSYNLFHRANCNQLIEEYSQLFTQFIDSMFFCHFDKFCGTYPVYYMPFSSHLFQFRGSLGKLPCPQSNVDIINLSQTPILTYDSLGSIWNSMQHLLHSDPCSSQSLSILSYPHNILGRDFTVHSKNDVKMRSGDAWERTIHSLMKLSRELGRIPEYEEWNTYYELNQCHTGEETEKRKSRFNAAVPYVEKTFDPDKIGGIYHYGNFIEEIKKNISEDEIERIKKEHSSYKYRVTYEDLDIGLGAHWMAVRTHNKMGKHLSVPRDAIPALFQALRKKGIIKRSCDLGKARAIRVVLLHMKYIKLVDDYYCWKKGNQISQRWGMDVNFPQYQEYQLFCGSSEKMALQIKKLREQGKGELVLQKNFLPQEWKWA